MEAKRIMPPACMFVAVLLMVAVHFVPAGRLIPQPWNLLGVVPLAVGVWISVWCSNLFGKAQTTIKPFERSNHLVTHGPYRISRHPMYLGMAVTLMGVAVTLGTVLPFVVVPVFVWLMDSRFIAPEERMMADEFGDAYRDYRKRVRRWI